MDKGDVREELRRYGCDMRKEGVQGDFQGAGWSNQAKMVVPLSRQEIGGMRVGA